MGVEKWDLSKCWMERELFRWCHSAVENFAAHSVSCQRTVGLIELEYREETRGSNKTF